MVPVADGGLGHLGEQGHDIAHEKMLHRRIAVEFLFEQVAVYTIGRTLALHQRAAQHGRSTHKDSDAYDALAPNDGDFGSRSILECQRRFNFSGFSRFEFSGF